MRSATLAIVAVVCAAASSVLAAKAPEKASSCRQSPMLAGRCYVVRGQLAPESGWGGLRILSLGSDRQLKVVDAQDRGGAEEDLLPRSVDRAIDRKGVDADLIADFTVCPLTPERAGWVQHVCVAAATDVSAHNPDEPPPKTPEKPRKAAPPGP